MLKPESAAENTVGNEENAGNQHFLLFPQCFLPYQVEKSSSLTEFFSSSANAFSLDPIKILSFDKDLIYICSVSTYNNRVFPRLSDEVAI